MNYELAKKLKEAGFPEITRIARELNLQRYASMEENPVTYPFLQEIISELGDSFGGCVKLDWIKNPTFNKCDRTPKCEYELSDYHNERSCVGKKEGEIWCKCKCHEIRTEESCMWLPISGRLDTSYEVYWPDRLEGDSKRLLGNSFEEALALLWLELNKK